MSEKTHVFSINHFGHTQIDLLVDWETGIDLATQASQRMSIYSRWKRDQSGRTGLTRTENTYIDIFSEGSITLKNLNNESKDQA